MDLAQGEETRHGPGRDVGSSRRAVAGGEAELAEGDRRHVGDVTAARRDLDVFGADRVASDAADELKIFESFELSVGPSALMTFAAASAAFSACFLNCFVTDPKGDEVIRFRTMATFRNVDHCMKLGLYFCSLGCAFGSD